MGPGGGGLGVKRGERFGSRFVAILKWMEQRYLGHGSNVCSSGNTLMFVVAAWHCILHVYRMYISSVSVHCGALKR